MTFLGSSPVKCNISFVKAHIAAKTLLFLLLTFGQRHKPRNKLADSTVRVRDQLVLPDACCTSADGSSRAAGGRRAVEGQRALADIPDSNFESAGKASEAPIEFCYI